MILRHGCSSHRCLLPETSFIVWFWAPCFLKTSLRSLPLCFFCLGFFSGHAEASRRLQEAERVSTASPLSDNNSPVSVIFAVQAFAAWFLVVDEPDEPPLLPLGNVILSFGDELRPDKMRPWDL